MSFLVVAFEKSDHYVEAAAVTVVAVLVAVYTLFSPGLGGIRLAERWAADHEVDRARALGATYTWARGTVARGVVTGTVWTALLMVGVGAVVGATGPRLVQYAILGAASGVAVALNHYAWFRGSSSATGQGRDRR